MEYITIEECCDILDSKRIPITASERQSGPYPYYGANGVQDYVADYIFDDELVLLAEDGGNFGSKTRPIAYRVSGKCWVNNHAHVLKPMTNVDVDYLCYSLMFYDTEELVNGATRQKLTQAAMRKMLIQQRSITEQKKIVSELSKIQSIISAHQQQLQKYDELIKARFIEMFGNPVTNSMGWPEGLIGDNCFVTKLAGFEYTQYINYEDSGDVVMVKAQNVKNGKLNRKELSFISKKVSDSLPRSQLEPGDVVMTYVGANIGDVAVIDNEYKYHLAPNVAKIRPDAEVYNSIYFAYMLLFLNSYIVKNSADTAKAALGMDRIRKLHVFVPPIELQNQFVYFVKQVDKSKFREFIPHKYDKYHQFMLMVSLLYIFILSYLM